MGSRKRIGQVFVERSSYGPYISIMDDDGALWAEADCVLDIYTVPEHLREDVQRAYDWAREQNIERRQDIAEEARRTLYDWNQTYNETRGI